VITPADDYPLHQDSRPFRDPGRDRNLYDRFFFCGYPINGFGTTYFAAAFGQYIGRNLCDGAFSVIRNGVQHSVRGSRLLGSDRLDLSVGPLHIEIVQPGRTLRVLVDDESLSADLTFHARGPGFEEPQYRHQAGNLTVFDITRMTQNGWWSGYLIVEGERIEVDESWLGTRDRSWGVRPVGSREPNLAPDGPLPTFYWLWAPLNFPDSNVLFDVNEYADGTRWHENAAVTAVDPEAVALLGSHAYSLTWKPGTRVAERFSMDLSMSGASPESSVTIELDPVETFYMQGIGYGHPTWGHGCSLAPTSGQRTSESLPTSTRPTSPTITCRCCATHAATMAQRGGGCWKSWSEERTSRLASPATWIWRRKRLSTSGLRPEVCCPQD
jgi:hypothetical protein